MVSGRLLSLFSLISSFLIYKYNRLLFYDLKGKAGAEERKENGEEESLVLTSTYLGLATLTSWGLSLKKDLEFFQMGAKL